MIYPCHLLLHPPPPPRHHLSSFVIFWLTPPSPSGDDVICEQPLMLLYREVQQDIRSDILENFLLYEYIFVHYHIQHEVSAEIPVPGMKDVGGGPRHIIQ